MKNTITDSQKNDRKNNFLLHGNLFILINHLKSKELSKENACLKKVILEFGYQILSYDQVCKAWLIIYILNDQYKLSLLVI